MRYFNEFRKIKKKISKSKMNKNVTIKGGVVMYGLSNDKRRATRDLDLDFIKYSLAIIKIIKEKEVKKSQMII